MVPDVKELRSELETAALVKQSPTQPGCAELLGHSEVPIVDAGQADDILGCIAERARWRQYEGAGVEVAGHGPAAAAQIGRSDQVGTFTAVGEKFKAETRIVGQQASAGRQAA